MMSAARRDETPGRKCPVWCRAFASRWWSRYRWSAMSCMSVLISGSEPAASAMMANAGASLTQISRYLPLCVQRIGHAARASARTRAVDNFSHEASGVDVVLEVRVAARTGASDRRNRRWQRAADRSRNRRHRRCRSDARMVATPDSTRLKLRMNDPEHVAPDLPRGHAVGPHGLG